MSTRRPSVEWFFVNYFAVFRDVEYYHLKGVQEMLRTYQPKKLQRKKEHGFRKMISM